MSNIVPNVIISMPSQLFTLARKFQAASNGKIFIGKIDSDPTLPQNQVQVYVENEDGSHVPVSQPIIINAAGYPVYNGQIAKFVTVQGHSMAVYDAYGSQQFYFPNVLKYDPDQLRQQLEDPDGIMKYPLLQISRWRDEGDVRAWGARGDYITDDTEAIIAADEWCAQNGKALYFPHGQFRCSNGIEKKAAEWRGVFSPKMGTFPNWQDDKRFLRPGYKNKIPGTTLIFSGTGIAKGSTVRSSPYDSFTYCVKDGAGDSSPRSMTNIAIVMDMDVLNESGGLTGISSDNRSNYDVGLFCNDVTRGRYENITVWGYFPVAGVIHYGSDPDGTKFINGSSSGNVGFIVLGTGSHGLSETRWDNWELYANDHHSRQTGQFNSTALVIDGGGFSINGHYITGGRIQQYGNDAIKLYSANNVVFQSVVMELPDYTSDPTANTSRFVGDDTTGDVYFIGCRFTDDPVYKDASCIGNSAGGSVILVGGPSWRGFDVWHKGKGLRARAETQTDGTTDSSIQFGSSANSTVSGLKIYRDDSDENKLKFRYGTSDVMVLDKDGNLKPEVNLIKKQVNEATTLPVISGAITVTRSFHRLSGGRVDLTTINGGTQWQRLLLGIATSSDIVTLKNASGNLRLNGDWVPNSGLDRIELQFDGVFWCEISRSINN